ncbi:tryptase-like [Anoplophora glabripennis]|uniref:tryptase-like n=1 Tax=Anoplophora glabripennis TaxID=217634 RepID=UPI00087528DA|nr:tryptase-like [Anoplophora glabripennis]
MMYLVSVLCIFFNVYINKVHSQLVSGVTSSGQTYLCLPTGTTCPSSSSSNTIDPRIVTPTQAGALCADGYFACYGQTTTCGTQYITPTTTTDGLADFGAYPWQAYLRNNTSTFSGSGVLLDEFHVLTAAHKVYRNVANPSVITVIMGVWNPASLDNTQSSTVSSITVHPSFVASTLVNDIAILTLSQPIVLGIYRNINTICLASTGASTSYVGQTCVVSGWGQTSFTTNDAPTSPQKQVYVTVVNYATCRASFANTNLLGSNVDTYLDPNGEICAGGQSMRDACSQDGGSPLSCPSSTGQYSVAGLVIWGKNCGQTGVYGVYVNVPYYYTWIQSILSQSVVTTA